MIIINNTFIPDIFLFNWYKENLRSRVDLLVFKIPQIFFTYIVNIIECVMTQRKAKQTKDTFVKSLKKSR